MNYFILSLIITLLAGLNHNQQDFKRKLTKDELIGIVKPEL